MRIFRRFAGAHCAPSFTCAGVYCLLLLIVLLPACATFRPAPLEQVPFHQRAESKRDGALLVSAVALSAEESAAVFGVPLAEDGIQLRYQQLDFAALRQKFGVQDVDDARYYLVQDLLLSGGVVKIGWVTGVGQADIATPRFNYTGDPYYTDGIRVVLLMGEQHVALEAIQYFPWGDPRHLVPQASQHAPRRLPGLVSWTSGSRIPWSGGRAPPTHPGEASRHLWRCDMRVQRVTRSHSRTWSYW